MDFGLEHTVLSLFFFFFFFLEIQKASWKLSFLEVRLTSWKADGQQNPKGSITSARIVKLTTIMLEESRPAPAQG